MTQFSEDHLVCAIDLGGTNLRAAIVDERGIIHARARRPTPHTNDPGKIVSAIASAVAECSAQGISGVERVDAVAVVVPGSVQAESGLVVNAPNVPAIVGFA